MQRAARATLLLPAGTANRAASALCRLGLYGGLYNSHALHIAEFKRDSRVNHRARLGLSDLQVNAERLNQAGLVPLNVEIQREAVDRRGVAEFDVELDGAVIQLEGSLQHQIVGRRTSDVAHIRLEGQQIVVPLITALDCEVEGQF